MFRFIFKKLLIRQKLNQNYNTQSNSSQESDQANLSADLKQNLTTIRNVFGDSSDLIFREFSFGVEKKVDAALVFIDGMSDIKIINESIMKPLMYDTHLFDFRELPVNNTIENIQKNLLSVGDVKKVSSIDKVVDGCLGGDTALFIDGSREAMLITSKGWEKRHVSEPKTEVVVRGPREGFTESLRVNTSMLRRKIRNADLTLETMRLGRKTKTDICIAYLNKVVNPKLVEEVKRRLKQINIDGILESGYIEGFIEDAPFSPFSTIANSEKPDVVAAKLLEGRLAVFVDGTPIVLTVPMVFIESFQSSEDYYSRPYYSSIVRMLRFGAFLITILAPAIYVALTTYHQEMIPTTLLITLAAAKEGTPFPAVVEVLIMGVIFEILREAGVRLPRPVGSAISIVGALVIGESAVAAGLIGAPVVIVISLTAIASFVVPAQSDVSAILRFIMTLLAGVLGAYGILLGLLWWLIHLTSLRSFGTPYMSPLAPLKTGDLKDTLIRWPIWAMFTRPGNMGIHDPQRQEFRLMPEPPPKTLKNKKAGN